MSEEATIYQLVSEEEVVYWQGYRPDCTPSLVTVREVDTTLTGAREIWVHDQRVELNVTFRMIPLDQLSLFMVFLRRAMAGEHFFLRIEDSSPAIDAEFEVVQENDPSVAPESEFPGHFSVELVIRIVDETDPLLLVTP